MRFDYILKVKVCTQKRIILYFFIYNIDFEVFAFLKMFAFVKFKWALSPGWGIMYRLLF